MKGLVRKRMFAMGLACVLATGMVFTDTMSLQAAENDLRGGQCC